MKIKLKIKLKDWWQQIVWIKEDLDSMINQVLDGIF
jgi:hypothetical protein